ncbi:TPA: hypothetical protein DCY65_01095 [Candidatus Acetothermia bacterium]|nr:hypothetical protein [Candidatus Acetothermia bacterium]
MDREIAQYPDAVARICLQYGVRHLDRFGSAATGGAQTGRSDLDFLVAFEPLPLGTRADAGFGLQEALERLFGRPVHRVVRSAIRNPYFRRSVERNKIPLYAA